MSEESDTAANSDEIAERVVATGEPLGSDDHDADTAPASPWPTRASPYV